MQPYLTYLSQRDRALIKINLTSRFFFLSWFLFIFQRHCSLSNPDTCLCTVALTCCITGACTPPGCICCCRRICCWGWMMYWAPLAARTTCRIWPEASQNKVWTCLSCKYHLHIKILRQNRSISQPFNAEMNMFLFCFYLGWWWAVGIGWPLWAKQELPR